MGMAPKKMDFGRLARLMRVRLPEDWVNIPTCPDEHEIAAFCGGTLGNQERDRIRVHLADCGTCAAYLALLSRLHDAETVTPTPELTLARAQRLTRHGRSQSVRRFSGWAGNGSVSLVQESGEVPSRAGNARCNSRHPSVYARAMDRTDADNTELLGGFECNGSHKRLDICV